MSHSIFPPSGEMLLDPFSGGMYAGKYLSARIPRLSPMRPSEAVVKENKEQRNE